MKLGFRAKFFWKDRYSPIYQEEKLNDLFLIFLPTIIEIIPVKESRSATYDIKMVTDQLFSLDDLREKLEGKKVLVKEISHIKRQFSKEELKKLQTMVCFKEIFSPTEED